MKRIKGFNLFENVSDINSLISYVNDICLELNDIEIYTKCSEILIPSPQFSWETGGNKVHSNLLILKKYFNYSIEL